MARPSDGMKPPAARAARAADQSGRTLPRVLVVILGVVLALALLASLFIVVGLPAIGCPKASSTGPVGSVSDYCFAPFTGGAHGIGGLVAGPDGNLWFTDGARIGRITPQGAITEFALPAGQDAGGPIVAGPDGNLWFVEQTARALGRITPRGAVSRFPLPPGDTYPVGLAAGPDGALWYTRSPVAAAAGGGPPNTTTPGLIGRMTVGGKATEFVPPTPPAPRPAAQPRDIIAGPDGALWFDTGMANGVAAGNSWIGRITTSGQAGVVYAPDPTALVSIAAIAAGPDHNVWFTESASNANSGGAPVGPPGGAPVGPPGGTTGGSPVVPPPGGPPQQSGAVGRLTPAGAVQLFPIPSSLGAAPGAITAGPDGNLWFATGKIARVTPGGQITAFSLPDPRAEIGPMAEGPGAAVWFAQAYPDIDPINGLIWGTKIGRVTA